MNAGGEKLGQSTMDQPVPGEAVLPRKRPSLNAHLEMGFAFGPGAGMAGVKMRFIAHLQRFRRKSFFQSPANFFSYFAHHHIS